MPLATALLTRQSVLQAKAEASAGVAETLANANGLFNIFEAKIDPTIPAQEREGQGTLSPLAPVAGPRMGKATFKSELVGSGTPATDPYWATVFLTACGMPITSHVAKPLTGSAGTVTIGHVRAGRLFEIAGAMGKWTLNAETGKPALFDWEFDGVWQPPTTVTMPAPAYPTVIPPRVAACTFTIGGTTYVVPKVEIAADNTLYMREDTTNVSGYAAACITQRKITVKVAPEALALGTKDWFADYLASNGAAFNLVIGSTSGNTFTLAAPNIVLMNPPGYEDRSGLYADSLEFLAVRNSSGGDDEFSITIG